MGNPIHCPITALYRFGALLGLCDAAANKNRVNFTKPKRLSGEKIKPFFSLTDNLKWTTQLLQSNLECKSHLVNGPRPAMHFYPFDHPKHSPSIMCPVHIILLTVLKQSRYPIKAINTSHAGINDEILIIHKHYCPCIFLETFLQSHRKGRENERKVR